MFKVGDKITVEGVTGKVIEMNKASVSLVTDNGNKVIFPLSKVSGSNIEIHI